MSKGLLRPCTTSIDVGLDFILDNNNSVGIVSRIPVAILRGKNSKSSYILASYFKDHFKMYNVLANYMYKY